MKVSFTEYEVIYEMPTLTFIYDKKIKEVNIFITNFKLTTDKEWTKVRQLLNTHKVENLYIWWDCDKMIPLKIQSDGTLKRTAEFGTNGSYSEKELVLFKKLIKAGLKVYIPERVR